MEFRALLVNLFNQLSGINRNELHFVVGDKVPRAIRENCTPSGSLNLLDCLLEQHMISRENPNYLISVFDQICCYDASEQLKEYKRSQRQYVLHTGIDESISSESLLLSRCFEDVMIDKGPSSPQRTPELENPSIQSRTTTSPEETYTFDDDNRKQPSSTIQRILHSKHNLACVISFTLVIVFIILFLVVVFHLNQPGKTNPPPSSLIVKQESFYLMKEGLRYGDYNFQKDSFNDANDIGLSYADRCIGVQVQWSASSLINIHFLYSNNRSSNFPNTKIKQGFVYSGTFMLTSNEEINKINLYQNLRQIVVGIQFCTTNKRKSAVFGSKEGNFLTESFEHYTFGYAKGWQHTEGGIGRLQFVWIKQMLIKERIATVPRNMVEMCEFSFIAFDEVLVHVKGIESSWYDLKRKFNRQDPEKDPKASYYETNSTRGPELFAIINGDSVYYHHDNIWTQYKTAKNIKCNIIPL